MKFVAPFTTAVPRAECDFTSASPSGKGAEGCFDVVDLTGTLYRNVACVHEGEELPANGPYLVMEPGDGEPTKKKAKK